MKNIFDEYAAEYDQWFVENDHLFDSELKALEKCVDRDVNYIEVGVGTGLFAKALGFKEGVDISDEMMAIAKKRGVKVSKASAEDLPYEDESVEGLAMITVDCFIDDIVPVFEEAYRVLKPNGDYIIAFLDKGTALGQEYERTKEDSIYYKNAKFRAYKEMLDILCGVGFTFDSSASTVYTLENVEQKILTGSGEGVFTVLKVKKEI